MGDVVPHAVNADGKEVLKELLTPLFITLAPGFEARADELRVEVTHPASVTCSYIKGSDSFPLCVAEGYEPWITSSRIRILCDMSIRPDLPRQDGRMAVRFGRRTIPVNAQVLAEGGREVMLFRPVWDASSAHKTAQRTGGSRSGIIEEHRTPDGLFRFIVERGDDGDLSLGFDGFPAHTHGDILASLSGLPIEAAVRSYIEALLTGSSFIGIARVAGKIRDAWVTDDRDIKFDCQACIWESRSAAVAGFCH